MTNLDDEILQTIRLIRTNRIGNITFFKIIDEFKTALNAVNNIPKMLSAVKYKGVENFDLYPKQNALNEIKYCNDNNIKIVPYFSKFYPLLLRKIENKPPLLFVKGNLELLIKKSVALVGSRNCSLNGSRMATNFAKELGKSGFNVVSGMAKGIDFASHKGALQTGTTAVLGCGVDVVYPKENSGIYQEIAKHGAIVSEFGCKTKPQAGFFPIRNRIISGMSRGVLVVESSLKSGAFSTASIAKKQQRKVMAIPSSPFNKQSTGNNVLIQQGANLVQSPSEVLNLLNDLNLEEQENNINMNTLQDTSYKSKNISNEDREKVKNILSYDPLEIDLIVRESNLSYQTVATIILEMELCGLIVRYFGNKVSLALK